MSKLIPDIRRVDSNQAEIVRKLRQHKELSVRDIHMIGHGFPDIIVGFQCSNYLFEIKGSWKDKLTPHEIKFMKEWAGQIERMHTYEEICSFLGIKSIEVKE